MRSRLARRLALVAAAAAVGGGVVATTGAGQSSTEALTAARFSITVDGTEIASFNQLVGITSEIDPVDYLASSDPEGVTYSKTPEGLKPPTITLKRGKTRGLELWNWHQAARSGVLSARKSGALVMYNPEGKAVARYHLEKAWPSKLRITGVKVSGSEVLYEEVTLVAEDIQRISQ